jgi:hypothetical protein
VDVPPRSHNPKVGGLISPPATNMSSSGPVRRPALLLPGEESDITATNGGLTLLLSWSSDDAGPPPLR